MACPDWFAMTKPSAAHDACDWQSMMARFRASEAAHSDGYMESLMRERALARICALATSCLGLGLAAQDVSQDDELQRFTESLTTTIASNVTNPAAYDTNGFHLVSSENAQLGADLDPDGHRFQMVRLTAPGVFGVMVE